MFTPNPLTGAMADRRGRMPEVQPDPHGVKIPHPAKRAPRIFADTATLKEIEPLLQAGLINGLTTNPTLLKRAGAKSWEGAKSIMRELCQVLRPYPVSLELTELTVDRMVKQAEELAALGDNSVIKVPIGGYTGLDSAADPFTGLKVIRSLWERGVKTNVTLIFNTNQAFFAAKAGATYVSPFLGRLADYAYKHDRPEGERGNSLYHVVEPQSGKGEPVLHNSEYVASGGALKDAGARLIFEIASVFANYRIETEILAASFRNPVQLTECLLAGADILTIPSSILGQVAGHPLSDAGMKLFAEDAKVFT